MFTYSNYVIQFEHWTPYILTSTCKESAPYTFPNQQIRGMLLFIVIAHIWLLFKQ